MMKVGNWFLTDQSMGISLYGLAVFSFSTYSFSRFLCLILLPYPLSLCVLCNLFPFHVFFGMYWLLFLVIWFKMSNFVPH